ncbi:MAG: TrmB family transcriptional regulator [Nanoarchaeota archaeon]|nr:TrmB family transcriptional regulator [Nanoarchaeota archaeon]
MLNNKEFVKEVKSIFELNLYEVKIWLALLSRGVSTAGELSTIANIPRSRAYDILDSLEKQGFVLLKMGKPIKYVAISPEDVTHQIKKKIDVEATRKKEVLNKLEKTGTMNKLSTLFTTGIKYVEPIDLSGLIKGRSNYHNQLSTMIKNAEKTVTITTTTPGLLRKLSGLKKDFKEAKERGVKIKILAPLNEETNVMAEKFKNWVEVEGAKQIKGRFAVADSKNIMFMLMHDEEIHPLYDSGIWVKSEFVGNAIEKMINQE